MYLVLTIYFILAVTSYATANLDPNAAEHIKNLTREQAAAVRTADAIEFRLLIMNYVITGVGALLGGGALVSFGWGAMQMAGQVTALAQGVVTSLAMLGIKKPLGAAVGAAKNAAETASKGPDDTAGAAGEGGSGGGPTGGGGPQFFSDSGGKASSSGQSDYQRGRRVSGFRNNVAKADDKEDLYIKNKAESLADNGMWASYRDSSSGEIKALPTKADVSRHINSGGKLHQVYIDPTNTNITKEESKLYMENLDPGEGTVTYTAGGFNDSISFKSLSDKLHQKSGKKWNKEGELHDKVVNKMYEDFKDKKGN